MSTRNIVPRANGEGSIGVSSKKWGDIQAVAGHIANRDIASDGAMLDSHDSAIDTLQTKVTTLEHAYAGAKAAATVSEMTDHNQIYVYVGSESGYINGNWYYWNGAAWTSGGVYQATALETDKTLTVSGAAADAKTVGDDLTIKEEKIDDINSALTVLNGIKVTYAQGHLQYVPASFTVGEKLTIHTLDGSNFDYDKIIFADANKTQIYQAYFNRSTSSRTYYVPGGNTIAYIALSGYSSQVIVVEQNVANSLTDKVNTNTANINYIKTLVGAVDVPSYFATHLSEKIDTLNNLLTYSSRNTLRFGFITDVHWTGNTKNSPALIDSLYYNTGLRNFFYGGDAINVGNKADMIVYIRRQMTQYTRLYKDRFYTMVGNHEFNTMGAHDEAITEDEIYNLMFKHFEDRLLSTNLYYFIDNVAQKTRYLVLNTGETGVVDATQFSWLGDTLLDTPNGYSIVLFAHWLYTSVNNELTPTSSCTTIFNFLKAAKEKQVFVYNNISYDFSQKNIDVICSLSGHTHEDAIFETGSTFPSIVTTCDKLNSESDRGTYNEQAFDVLTIDKDARTIKLTRIGRGSDRETTF